MNPLSVKTPGTPEWSEAILNWREEQLSSPRTSKDDAERLRALLAHTGMIAVAERFQRESSRNSALTGIPFLLKAWQAEEIYEDQGQDLIEETEAPLPDLGEACEGAYTLLSKAPRMATYWLAWLEARSDPSHGDLHDCDDPTIKNPVYMKRGAKRLQQLLEGLKIIGGAAEHDSGNWPPPNPSLPRVKNIPTRRQVFYIKLLLQAAKKEFGSPLIPEVAATVAVIQDKEANADLGERVSEIWNGMKDKKEYWDEPPM